MDTTYKTNTHEWPVCQIVGVTPTNLNFLVAIVLMDKETAPSYVWILERVKNLLGDNVVPNAIVTDRDLGMSSAIPTVFPTVPHMLCVWHIGKDVMEKVSKLTGGKQNGKGEVFRKRYWDKIMYADTEEEYERMLEVTRTRWVDHPRIMQYLEDTWLGVKHKFVKAWTDRICHFRNVATSRVESQHSSLKYHLGTSRDAIDTFFLRVHGMIENQHTKIRKTLEESRTQFPNIRRGPLWANLVYKVSQNCMDHIQEQLYKMQALGEQVFEYCGCEVRTVLGVPCACSLAKMFNEGRQSIYLDEVHQFWKSLVISDGVDIPQFADGNRDDDDISRYRKVSDRVLNEEKIEMIRYCTRLLEETLDPHDLPEPESNPPRKGRPQMSRSTRRDPSSFEYTSSGGRGSGRKSTSSRGSGRGRTSTQGSGRGTESTVDLDFDFNLAGGILYNDD